jgi:hypothetical protein
MARQERGGEAGHPDARRVTPPESGIGEVKQAHAIVTLDMVHATTQNARA